MSSLLVDLSLFLSHTEAALEMSWRTQGAVDPGGEGDAADRSDEEEEKVRPW